MTQTSKQNTRHTALRDLRILTTTLSLTAIIGLWNLFSRPTSQDLAAAESDNLINAGPAPVGEDGLPPLPTLVTIDDVVIHPNNMNTAEQTAGAAASLREVTAPTPVVIQNRPPVVESVVIGQQPADSGGSSSKPKPASNSGSSK